jgi:hypothetical protein
MNVKLIWNRVVNHAPESFKGVSTHVSPWSLTDDVNTQTRWHQDVKPANILVVLGNSESPYDVTFKLADLGLSHFSKVVAGETDPTGEDLGGSRAYGMAISHSERILK